MKSLLNFHWGYRLFIHLVKSDAFFDLYWNKHVRCQPNYRVLDLGCGPADILEHLPAGIEYHGVDGNPNYIEFARARFGSRGTFYCENISPSLKGRFQGFDLVMANGVLHHLTDEEGGALIGAGHEALLPAGRLVSIDGVYFPGQSRLTRWVVSQDRGQFVRTDQDYLKLAARFFSDVKHFIYDGQIRIPYSQIVMEMTKSPG